MRIGVGVTAAADAERAETGNAAPVEDAAAAARDQRIKTTAAAADAARVFSAASATNAASAGARATPVPVECLPVRIEDVSRTPVISENIFSSCTRAFFRYNNSSSNEDLVDDRSNLTLETNETGH